VQLALALPLFLFVLVGCFQFLLTLHVQAVALGAAENGAALAASRGAPAAVGKQRAQELMTAGLGTLGTKAQVQADEDNGAVIVDVRVQLQPLTPLTDRLGLTTVHARGRATREAFRPGGGSTP
jgi:Flp pilus assembly protein TadG